MVRAASEPPGRRRRRRQLPPSRGGIHAPRDLIKLPLYKKLVCHCHVLKNKQYLLRKFAPRNIFFRKYHFSLIDLSENENYLTKCYRIPRFFLIVRRQLGTSVVRFV